VSLFNAVSLLIALVAVCGYLNARFVKLPDVIGITAVGLILSVLMAIVGNKHPEWTRWAQTTLNELDFTEIVFHGMLGMLLFAVVSIYLYTKEMTYLVVGVVATSLIFVPILLRWMRDHAPAMKSSAAADQQ